MAKYGRPDSVVPTSNTRAMLGWSIMARACSSASKRAITCWVSMPGLMILSATRRSTGSVCSAMYTTPNPPSPICCSSLYGPICVPGFSVDGLVDGRGGSSSRPCPGTTIRAQRGAAAAVRRARCSFSIVAARWQTSVGVAVAFGFGTPRPGPGRCSLALRTGCSWRVLPASTALSKRQCRHGVRQIVPENSRILTGYSDLPSQDRT